MSRAWKASVLFLFGTLTGFAQSSSADRGPGLIGQLGCVYCHRDLPAPSSLRDLTPDLSSAGLRYNPAYLLDYLQNPTTVRKHLGRARMPNFHFGVEESLALVAFLGEQHSMPRGWPFVPAALRAGSSLGGSTLSQERIAMARNEIVACLSCHTHERKGGDRAVAMADIGFRLEPDWVRQFLVSPQMFGVSASNMPPLFYRLAEDRTHFEFLNGEPSERIRALVDYLFSLNQEKRSSLQKKYAEARARFPKATATLGEKIFRGQNCAGCHRIDSVPPRLDSGPLLAVEGQRVQPDWLLRYLQHPGAIRPFGYHPGDGSRMPDFHLAPEEAQEISAYLSELGNREPGIVAPFQTQVLSAFARQKAKLLLVEKLSCLGCHSLGGNGGKAAPDLALAHGRLQPAYIYGMISNPRALNPHTIMPRAPLTQEAARLTASFLAAEGGLVSQPSYLSLTDNPPLSIPTAARDSSASGTAGDAYVTYCSACHGETGRGDGFNAAYLPKRPTAHADAAYMDTRPDDTLYDGVASGGAILSKSHFMPAWGNTLAPSEIRDLVVYMRSLCRCQGPGWSWDPLESTCRHASLSIL